MPLFELIHEHSLTRLNNMAKQTRLKHLRLTPDDLSSVVTLFLRRTPPGRYYLPPWYAFYTWGHQFLVISAGETELGKINLQRYIQLATVWSLDLMKING